MSRENQATSGEKQTSIRPASASLGLPPAMADLQADDYYANLGVARSASEQEIKSACVPRLSAEARNWRAD